MKNTKAKYVFSIIFILVIASALHSYETKSGDVSGETWSNDTYYLSGDISVITGTILTVNPGTVIKVESGIQINIYGTLDVNGNSESGVIFTSKNDDDFGEYIPDSSRSPSAGDWKGIYCYGYLDNQGIGEFDYCYIAYGGHTSGSADANVFFDQSDSGYFNNSTSEYSSNYGIQIYSCSPSISSSSFTNNQTHGIYAFTSSSAVSGNEINENGSNGIYFTGSSSDPTITNNNFLNNTGYPIYLNSIIYQPYSGNTVSGNSIDGLVINGYMPSDGIWSADLPFVIVNNFTVNNGVVLTIPPGNIIKASGRIVSLRHFRCEWIFR